jgi:hypothetical protein
LTSVCRPFRITKVNLIPSNINERVQFFLPRFDFSIFDKSLTCLIADAPPGSLGDQMTVRSGAMWLWAKKTIPAPRYGVDARPPPFEPAAADKFGGPGQNATPYRGGKFILGT